MRRVSHSSQSVLPFVVGLIAIAVGPAVAADAPWIVRSRAGVVASDSAEASRVGAEVLRKGGNAFDAAVATSLALGVTRPYSTGLGGGGFMLAYVAKEQRVVVLDFREVAPAAATAEHYAKVAAQAGDGPSPTVYGGHAIGVPGLLAGLGVINERYGSLPFNRLVHGAGELALRGFEADQNFVDACRTLQQTYAQHQELAADYPELGLLFLLRGEPPKVGDRVFNPGLVETLSKLGPAGPKLLYEGEVAEALVAAARRAGSVLTLDDLANYTVREREPIRGTYRGYDIISMPPPSSGGVAIVQTLNILEHKLAAQPTLPPPVPMMHLRIEAMKHAFADRARWLGDADYADVPVERLISKDYAKTLAERVSLTAAGSANGYGIEQLPDDRGTSHFCITDSAGNIVSLTETINGNFGSLVVVERHGIILNNEMDDFLTVRGQPNLYGLVQGEANLVAPGKRPLSSMSPTLVMKDGQPVLTLGGSGGPRIISSVLNVMLNVLDIELSLQDALASVRAHHQWRPDEVFFDRAIPDISLKGLRTLGHKIADEPRTGIIQAIQWLPSGEKVAASDPRKGGRPAAE